MREHNATLHGYKIVKPARCKLERLEPATESITLPLHFAESAPVAMRVSGPLEYVGKDGNTYTWRRDGVELFALDGMLWKRYDTAGWHDGPFTIEELASQCVKRHYNENYLERWPWQWRTMDAPPDDGRMSVMRIDLESMTSEEYESYRARCDARSAADFRMRRELCGIGLSELADELGVRIDTAKRWENPNKGMPPSVRAWARVDSAYLDLLDAVEAAVDKADELSDAIGEPAAVHLAYRRHGMPTRDGETIDAANAVARAAAIALAVLGYEVDAQWADEGAAGIAAIAPLG